MNVLNRKIGPRPVFLVLLATMSTLLSCDDLGSPGEGEPLPPDLRHAILPLVLRNQWTYNDTLRTGEIIEARTFTASVISVRRDGPIYWWRLQNRFSPSIAANEFMVRGDSIFSLQYTDSPGGLAPVVSLEYIPAHPPDTLTYRSIFFGDAGITKSVFLQNGKIRVPAGEFAGCLVYRYDITPEHYQEIAANGVGIISCEIRADSSAFGPAWYRKLVLAGYELKKNQSGKRDGTLGPARYR